MSEIKTFEFGGKAKVAANVIGEFVLQGETLHVRALKDTHIAYLVRAAQRKGRHTEIITAVINFMHAALIEADAQTFEDIVLGDPGLDMEEVVEVFTHVLHMVGGEGSEGAAPKRKPAARRSGNPALRAAN